MQFDDEPGTAGSAGARVVRLENLADCHQEYGRCRNLIHLVICLPGVDGR